MQMRPCNRVMFRFVPFSKFDFIEDSEFFAI